jgi:hypothetical protein
MPAIEELLPVDQAAALEQLRARLLEAELERIREPAHAGPRTVPAAVFRAPAHS